MGDDWDDDDEWAEEAPAKAESPVKASPTENSSDFVKLDESQGEYLYLYVPSFSNCCSALYLLLRR